MAEKLAERLFNMATKKRGRMFKPENTEAAKTEAIKNLLKENENVVHKTLQTLHLLVEHEANRKIALCDLLEDEHHAIFVCPLYNATRIKHAQLLQNYANVEEIFNPGNVQDAVKLGNILLDLEHKRKELGLVDWSWGRGMQW